MIDTSDFDCRLRIDENWIVHIIPFKDHIGNLEFMVFNNCERVPLPPLFSFSIYFVQADTGWVNMGGLYEELNSRYRGCIFDIRLDMYFLPGTSHADCLSHYLAEKSARGCYEKQVHTMFKTLQRQDIHPPSGTDFQLPGMVNKYHWRRNVLFICSERDWYEGQRTLWYLRSGSGWKTKATGHALPLFHAERAIKKSSPTYDFDRFNEPVDEIIMDMAGDTKELYRVW